MQVFAIFFSLVIQIPSSIKFTHICTFVRFSFEKGQIRRGYCSVCYELTYLSTRSDDGTKWRPLPGSKFLNNVHENISIARTKRFYSSTDANLLYSLNVICYLM